MYWNFLLLTDRYTSSQRSFSSDRESFVSVRVVTKPKNQTKDDLSNVGIAVETYSLDGETLELLGEKASTSENNNLDLHQEIGDRWQIRSHDGLNKDLKKELLQKYPRKGNYHFEVPVLDPESESSISESVRRRHKFFTADQNTLGSALSALGPSLSILFGCKYEERERPKAMKCLLDAGKLLSESYYQMSKTRKIFFLSEFRSQVQKVLERGKSDSFLFGQELSTRLKSAKSMEKVSLTLKPSQPSVVQDERLLPSCFTAQQIPSGEQNAELCTTPPRSLQTSGQFTSNNAEVNMVSHVPGRLKKFADVWSEFTNDKFILNVINGYKIPFNELPVHTRAPPEPVSSILEEQDYCNSITRLLKIGASNKYIPCRGQFLSSYFLVDKSDGTERFILNLKKLTDFITPEHFKM